MLTIYELTDSEKKFIYESKPVAGPSAKDLRQFEVIEINTDVFEGEKIASKVIEIVAKEVTYDKKGEKVKAFASETVRVKDIISMLEGETMKLNMKNPSNKTVAHITISEALIQPCFSFLDYKVHREVNVIPIIAIDYSLSNLTFDNQKCIHSLKEGASNDYINVIQHITNAYQNISSHMLAFGMGARTIPKKGDTSNLFALSGDIFNPQIEKDKLFQNYADTLKRIELSLPVNYHDVLETASGYARYEAENYEARNYFVLIYVSVGVIDDFEDTLNRLKEISDLPLTVIMIKVRNMQTEDTNDPAVLIKECAQSFAACERKYLEIIDFEQYKKDGKFDEFENELVSNIPLHVQKYMAIHNVFAHDIEGDDLGSRMSIAIKKEQTVRKQGEEYSDEVKRRRSMVNLKEFAQNLKQNDTLQDVESKASTSRLQSREDSELEMTVEQLDMESPKVASPNQKIKVRNEEEKISDSEVNTIEVPKQSQLFYTTVVEERKDRDLFDKVPSFFDELERREGKDWFPPMSRHSFSAC